MKNDAVNTAKAVGDDVERALLRFIGDEVAADGAGLASEENLIDSGRVDSLGLLHILAFIDARYRVDLMRAGNPRDLQSVASLAAAIRRETAAPGAAERG